VVPVSEGRKLATELDRLGVAVTMKTYPGVGHYPTGQKQSELADETVLFFKNNLARTTR